MNLNSTFKLALRSLRRDKTFSLINIIGLSLGLVSCAFVFLYSAHSLTYDQYHEAYESIYRINSSWVGTADKRSMAITAPAVGHKLQRDYSFIDAVGIISAMGELQSMTVDENTFEITNFRNGDRGVLDVFTFNLLSGTKTDEGLYIDEAWAIKLFGKVDCVGESVMIADQAHQISGVFEAWPQNVDLPLEGLLIQDYSGVYRDAFAFITYVKSGIESIQLTQTLATLSDQLYDKEEFNGDDILLEPVALRGLHFQESIMGDMPKGNKTYTYLALSTAIILVIIVLINISNLSIIRAMDAIKLNGIRKILGARNVHIQLYQAFQLVVLFMISACIALTLFQLISPYFTELTGIQVTADHFPLLASYVSIFLILILLIGTYAERISIHIKPVNALKNQLSNRLPGGMIRKSLVTFQFVITGLIISSLLVLITQWDYIQSKDLGFNAKNVAVISLLNRDVDAQILKTEISSIIDEENISLGTWNTMPGADVTFTTASIPESQLDFPVNVIDYDPNFLNVFEINLLSGTMPTTNILESGQPQPVLINQALSKLLDEPINNNIQLTWMKSHVKGVISDYNYQSLHNSVEPLVLMPQQKNARLSRVFVKLPLEKMSDLQHLLSKKLDAKAYSIDFMDQMLLENYQQEKEAISLIFYFALISFFISILGIVGVVSYMLKKREYEIGIRKVLGASLSNLCALFGSEVMELMTLSGLICAPLAYILKDQILGLYAFQVNFHWWYLLLPTVAIIITAMVIVFYQIIKAGQVNPVNLLKDD